MTGNALPGWDLCVGIARGLGEVPEKVLRIAGLLPSLPPEIEEERECLSILRGLPANLRGVILTQIRALAGHPPPAIARVSEPQAAYDAGDSLEREILREFRQLPEEWQLEAIREARRLRRYSQMSVRIIGGEEEDDGSPAQDEEAEADAA